MNFRSPAEALYRLIQAFPKCCACSLDTAVMMNEDRFWLCEKCFLAVPCSNKSPSEDLRGVLYGAIATLANHSLTDPHRK